MRLVAIAALAVVVPAIARAEPAVDPADLPPLPAAEDAPSSSATVLAAATAEEDVVVGAAKREQSLGNVASAVTVITADRIRRFGYRTVAEALAGVAGVFLEDTRLTTNIGIRGLQVPGGFNSRILLLVDGATVNEAWGAFAGVGFDALVSLDEIARIEVIRGPVGAVYGTNAFFGIINIVTRGAADAQRAWGRIGVHSIHGEVATAGFAAGGVNKQLRGSVLAMNRIGETSSVPGVGTDLKADGAQTLIASLVGSYEGSFAQLRAFRSRRDSPFAPYDANPDLDPAYSLYNTQLLIEGGHTRELSKRVSLAVRGYFNLYRYNDRINNAVDDHFLDYGDALTVGMEARARYELADNYGLTAGAEANFNKTKSRAFTEGMESTAVIVPLDFNIEGVYTEVDGQPTSWFGFTGGLRFDRNSVIDRRLSPRGALFFAKPEQYGLKLLYAEGFRNPSAFEGYFADGVDFSANPGIKSETIRSFEIVLWAKPVTGLSTRLSGFFWDARDVAEQQPDPDDPTLLQFQNVGRYVSEGLEAEASYRTARGWYAFGGFALARVGSANAGSAVAFGDVVNAPAVTATGGASTPRLWDRVHVSAELQLMSERVTRTQEDGSASPASPAWVGVNAAIYLPDVRGFDLTVGARNIVGKRDLMPAPGDYDRFPEMMPTVVVPRIPGEGREVYVKAGYSY